MARRNRTPSRRTAALRWAIGLFRVLASLQLAVLLIGVFAVLLAWATFVENRYGTAAVRFGIYGTWWFTTLGVLLALNIFCAAAIRFPWKRRQTGFVVTHLGLLVLLAGFLLGRVGGIHATLPVFEGRANWKAFEDSQHFALNILPPGDSAPPADGTETKQAPIVVPFRAGPFNWNDYGKLFPFPWRLARRDRGLLYDRDGIKLEVLDYYSDSKKLSAPRLELKVNPQQGSSPAAGLSVEPWLPVTLVIGAHGGPQAAMHRFGMDNRHTLSSGWRFVFWMTDSAAQVEAFADSAPRGPLGSHGRIVLHAGGERFEFAVDELQKQPRRALGQTGRELEFLGFDPRFLAVRLMIHQKDTPSRQMVLLADMPDFNRQDPDHGVFGAFWYDAAQPAADQLPDQRTLRRAALPRIDILQGLGGRLYYRTWRSPQAGTAGPLPADGREVAARAADSATAFYVEKYLPLDTPGTILLPVAFSKGGSQGKQRQARVRLTVDGNSQEFFLEGTAADPLSSRPTADQRKVVEGKGRRVAVTMPADEIDIGFQVYLHRFNRKLDPGTSQASHYSSLVDFCDRRDQGKRLHEQITITPNGPVDFSDPQSGRSYRLFQESFRGPWRRGHPLFDEVAGADSDRRQLFLSWLRVNYDPGRGLKYAGSFLIVLGIVIMYYMKAYFFKRTKTRCQA